MNSSAPLFRSRIPRLFFPLLLLLAFAACRSSHVKVHPEWAAQFKAYGIDSGCFELIDHAHEQVHLYNQARCTERFSAGIYV